MSDSITTEATGQAAPESIFISITEAATLMGCSYSKAQQAVSACNKRAKSLGLFTITGKCNRRALLEYLGVYRESFFDAPKGAR